MSDISIEVVEKVSDDILHHGANYGLNAYGLITNVAESRSITLTKFDDGTMEIVTTDFNRDRKEQLHVTKTAIEDTLYHPLCQSFDKLGQVLIDGLSNPDSKSE